MNSFYRRIVALLLFAVTVMSVLPTGITAHAATETTKIVQITGNPVNVRSGAGTYYSKVGRTYKGNTYDYIGQAEDKYGTDWYQIQYGSKKGWVTSQFSKVIVTNSSETDTIVKITGNPVNVRASAGLKYAKIGRTYKGYTYTYLGERKDSSGVLWYQIQYTSSKTGWVTSQYSKKITPVVVEEPTVDTSTPQDYIASIAETYGAEGVQVAVINDGVVAGTYNYGWATIETDKMTSEHKIRVASISKVAVAINTMKMQEQGLVTLDENIGTYWSTTLPKKVTLRSLLTHTSTLGDLSYTKDPPGVRSQLANTENYRSGTVGAKDSWCYNNYGIGIAGATLEVAADSILVDYSRDNIFAPLGMDASFVTGTISDTSKLATLYYSDGSVARSVSTAKNMKGNSTPGSNSAYFAGGLTCSAEDLAKMVAMLANDGTYNNTQVLMPESVAAMEKRYFTRSANGGSFMQALALRYKKDLYGESELYYHTGNAYGVLSLMSYNPATKDGVVVITTGASAARDSQGVYAVCSDITKYIYENII